MRRQAEDSRGDSSTSGLPESAVRTGCNGRNHLGRVRHDSRIGDAGPETTCSAAGATRRDAFDRPGPVRARMFAPACNSSSNTGMASHQAYPPRIATRAAMAEPIAIRSMLIVNIAETLLATKQVSSV